MSVGVMKDYKLKLRNFTRLAYTGLVVELEHLKMIGATEAARRKWKKKKN